MVYIRSLFGSPSAINEIIVSDTAALSNVVINESIKDGAVAIVGDAVKYRWNITSVATASNTTVVPLDGTNPGRWVIDTVSSFINSIADLRKTIPPNTSANSTIDLLAYSTLGDGGGGHFYWDPTSTDTDDNGSVIQATGIVTGRWKRQFFGPINVQWFGIRGNDNQANAINNTSRLNAMIISVAAGGFGQHIYFPRGIFYFNNQILIDRIPGLHIEGAGMGYATIIQYVGPDDTTEVKPFVLIRRSAEVLITDMVIVAQIDSTHRMGKCVQVTSDGYTNIGESGPIHTIFERVSINNGIDVAYQIGSDINWDVNTDRCALIDCNVGGSRYGVRISNTNTNNFQMIGGSVQTNTIAGIEVINFPRGTLLQNVQMSGNTTMRQSVTFDHTTNIFTHANHGLQNNATVELWDGTMPNGFIRDQQYFLVNRTKNTFQLATSPSDVPVTASNNGSGLTFNCGADIIIRTTFGSGIEINGKQTELFYPYLKVDTLTQGTISLHDLLASYSLPNSPVTADVYKIIDFRGDGLFNLENCTFYGPSEQLANSVAPIYVHPVTNTSVAARAFLTKNLTLFQGAFCDVLTDGNGLVRWIDLGTNFHPTIADAAPTVPHVRLHEKMQIMAAGKMIVEPITGMTVRDLPLLGTKTVAYVFDKTAFTDNASSMTFIINVYGRLCRVKSVMVDVETAFTGVAGDITVQVGDTSVGLDCFIVANKSITTAQQIGLEISDLGKKLYGGSVTPFGHVGSLIGNAQCDITVTSILSNPLGNGAGSTHFTTGLFVVYITFEEVIV